MEEHENYVNLIQKIFKLKDNWNKCKDVKISTPFTKNQKIDS